MKRIVVFIFIFIFLISLIQQVYGQEYGFKKINYMFPSIVIKPYLASIEGSTTNILLLKILRGETGESEYFVPLCWIIEYIDDGSCTYTHVKEDGSYKFENIFWNAEEAELYWYDNVRAQQAVNSITSIYGEELAKVFAYLVYPLLYNILTRKIGINDMYIKIAPKDNEYVVVGGYLNIKKNPIEIEKLISLDLDSTIKANNVYFDLTNGKITLNKEGRIIFEWKDKKIELTNIDGDFYFVPKENKIWWEKNREKGLLFLEINNEIESLNESIGKIIGKIKFNKDSRIGLVYKEKDLIRIYELQTKKESSVFLTEKYLCLEENAKVLSDVFDYKTTEIGRSRCIELATGNILAFYKEKKYKYAREFFIKNNKAYYSLEMLKYSKEGIYNGFYITGNKIIGDSKRISLIRPYMDSIRKYLKE